MFRIANITGPALEAVYKRAGITLREGMPPVVERIGDSQPSYVLGRVSTGPVPHLLRTPAGIIETQYGNFTHALYPLAEDTFDNGILDEMAEPLAGVFGETYKIPGNRFGYVEALPSTEWPEAERANLERLFGKEFTNEARATQLSEADRLALTNLSLQDSIQSMRAQGLSAVYAPMPRDSKSANIWLGAGFRPVKLDADDFMAAAEAQTTKTTRMKREGMIVAGNGDLTFPAEVERALERQALPGKSFRVRAVSGGLSKSAAASPETRYAAEIQHRHSKIAAEADSLEGVSRALAPYRESQELPGGLQKDRELYVGGDALKLDLRG